MKFCALTQTGMKLKKNEERSESRSVSPPAQDWAAAERAGNDRLLTIWARTPECPDHARKEEPGAKSNEQAKEGESQRHTHAAVVGRQEKGAGSDLGAVFSSSLLLGSWLGQSPPLLPLPQDHFVLSPLLPCQCSYLCIKWTNHRGGKNDIWLCWKVQKTLINGEVIKLNQKSVIRVICCYILSWDSQHILSSFNIKIQKSLVLVTFSLPLANPYSTCTKEEAE